MAQWPDVEIRLELADRMVDLVDEGYDLAVRLGQLTDSSLIAKRLAAAPMSVIASPAYLDQHGVPDHPSALSRQSCIIDRNKPAPNLWKFSRGSESAEVKVAGRLSLNGARAAVAAASAGVGIACAPAWAAQNAVSTGVCTQIFEDWDADQRDLWAVFPSNRYLAHRVRLFVDHLADWFKDGL